MMTEELKVKVTLDTSGLNSGIKQMKDTLSNASSGVSGMDKATRGAANSTKGVTTAMAAMGATSVAQTAIIAKSMNKVTKAMAPTKSYVKLLKDDFKGLFSGLGKNFDAAGDNKIKAWLGTLKTGLKEVGETGKLVGKQIREHFGGAFKTAALVAVKGIGAIVGAISGLLFAMTKLSSSTREFRQAINQVNTSFITLGSNAETATATYQAFFRVLGDVQRSAEAANLLGQITTAEKDLVTWTQIATGAMAMFPDSLPTESLIEAANETIKTAKVTGTLADALNWPAGAADKISKALEGSAEAQAIFNKGIREGMTVEDAFNTVLAETNNETQREIILRASLNGIYAQSAGLYEEMNKELIKQNEAQLRLNNAMAKLGQIAQPVQTAFTNFRAVLAEALAPAIKIVCDWLVKLIGWLTTAAAWVGAFLAVLFPGVAEKLNSAFSGVGSSINSAVGGSGDLNEGLQESEKTAQKLRRTLMGFDELNVVSSMSSGGSDSGSGSGGVNGGGGIDVSGLETGDSVFKKAQEQMEDFKVKAQEIIDKIKGFFQEWKPQIATIAAALGLLGLANLIGHFGEVLGLGDKFLAMLGTIKKIATTAIVITLQYSLVNEFMDNFIDGEGFKEYLKGLIVAAIGTGVLYAMWGPTGLAIGLAVTAVASIKAVIDNGGITNLESGVVALTGLATAIGAIGVAWNKLGLAKIVGDFGAFIALLKEGAGLGPTLAAAFPGIATALSSVGTALSGFLGSIGAVFGATGTAAVVAGAAVIVAAIAGIISVIVFLKEHWDEVGEAARKFFEQNIAPKIDSIRESFSKIGDALGPVGEFIGNIITKIAEWVKSIDWLDGIGKAFEVLGGVIFGAVSGVIAGAINMAVSIFEGLVQGISGCVQVLSGLIEAIIKLFSGDLDGARIACKKILDGIVDIFSGLYDATIGAVVKFVEGVIDWCVKLWDELVGHSIIPDMMDDIVQCFKELPGRVWTWLAELVNGVISRLTQMWTNVITGCQTKLGEMRTTIMNVWNNIRTYFNTNIAPKFTLDYWRKKFDIIRNAIQTKLGETRTQMINSWNSIKSYFTSNIAPKFTLTYWKNKLDTIRSAASTKLNEAKTTIMNAWNNIKSWFNNNVSIKFTSSFWKTKFDSIKNGAKSAFNGIIAVVEKAVNNIIKKINTLSWKIPDWVPSVGGKSFGFNFKTVSIPRLAEGGIAVGSTLANIGERGKEAILPLENNTGWMDSLADRLAARMNPATKVVLKVDERELGYATINAINQNTKQTGGLKLQLV